MMSDNSKATYGPISANLAPMSLRIAPHNRPLLTFHPDGTISVADHVSANDAAKGVIDALSDEFGEMIARAKAEAQAEIEALRARVAELEAQVAADRDTFRDADIIDDPIGAAAQLEAGYRNCCATLGEQP